MYCSWKCKIYLQFPYLKFSRSQIFFCNALSNPSKWSFPFGKGDQKPDVFCCVWSSNGLVCVGGWLAHPDWWKHWKQEFTIKYLGNNRKTTYALVKLTFLYLFKFWPQKCIPWFAKIFLLHFRDVGAEIYPYGAPCFNKKSKIGFFICYSKFSSILNGFLIL